MSDVGGSVGNGDVADPGWLRGLGQALLVYFGLTAGNSGRDTGALVAVRAMFVVALFTTTGVGAVVGILYAVADLEPSTTSAVPALVVGAVGIACHVLLTFLRRTLVGHDASEVAARWRQRAFLQIGVSQVPALVAFGAFLLAVNPLIYVLGWLLTVAALARCVPSAARLRDQQEQLQASGSPVQLVSALLLPPPSET